MVKHSKLLLILTFVVIGMFGFGFALVPIYNRMCVVLGINGKVSQDKTFYDAKNAVVDKNRTVLVEFVATQNSMLPWKFYPKTKKIRIHPGEVAKLAFYAENQTGEQMTVQAIPSITPGIAAKYLKKTECFCFRQQTLNGHEAMDMPLLFHLDPELPSEVHTVTLSYTLYDVSPKRVNRY